MDKITQMLQSSDREMIEMGIFYLLREPLRPAEINTYLQYFINKNFYYIWRLDPEEEESPIMLCSRSNVDSLFVKDPTKLLKLTPMKVKNYDTES